MTRQIRFYVLLDVHRTLGYNLTVKILESKQNLGYTLQISTEFLGIHMKRALYKGLIVERKG